MLSALFYFNLCLISTAEISNLWAFKLVFSKGQRPPEAISFIQKLSQKWMKWMKLDESGWKWWKWVKVTVGESGCRWMKVDESGESGCRWLSVVENIRGATSISDGFKLHSPNWPSSCPREIEEDKPLSTSQFKTNRERASRKNLHICRSHICHNHV